MLTMAGSLFGINLILLLGYLCTVDAIYGDLEPAEALEDLSDEDWVWTLFFDGLRRGIMNTSYLRDLYHCSWYNEYLDRNTADHASAYDESCAADHEDTDRSCDSSPIPPHSRIPTEEIWNLFEEAYYAAVDMKAPPHSEFPQQYKNEKLKRTGDGSKRWFFEAQRGIKIPYEVRYNATNSNLGRAIHATTFIPNGTIVWTGSTTAGFTHNSEDNTNPAASFSFQLSSFRKFIEYLDNQWERSSYDVSQNDESLPPDSHNWVCDALMWTFYSTKMDKDERSPALCIAFDHGTLFNNAMENKMSANLRDTTLKKFPPTRNTLFGLHGVTATTNKSIELPGAECQLESMLASRDIHPGEGKH